MVAWLEFTRIGTVFNNLGARGNYTFLGTKKSPEITFIEESSIDKNSEFKLDFQSRTFMADGWCMSRGNYGLVSKL